MGGSALATELGRLGTTTTSRSLGTRENESGPRPRAGAQSSYSPEAKPRWPPSQPRWTTIEGLASVARASARSPFERRYESAIEGVSWQHRGNIHAVSNRPDRPRNPAVADNLDAPGHYERAARKVEGLDRLETSAPRGWGSHNFYPLIA